MAVEFLFHSCINKSSRVLRCYVPGMIHFIHGDYEVGVNRDEEGDATSGELSSQ
jgi:hypothetical protein